MKNVLMMHYDLFFYRVPFYNLLQKELRKRNVNLIIWAYSIQDGIDINEINFELIDGKDLKINLKNYNNIVNNNKIDKVINFLQPSQPGYFFYISFILFTIVKNKSITYYGHGVNLEKNNACSNFIYNLLHIFHNKIILYSPNEKKYLWDMHQAKIEIANNTLCLDSYFLMSDSEKDIQKDRLSIKHDSTVILFSGRITKNKNLKSLLEIFEDFKKNSLLNIELVIVGPGLNDSNKNIVDNNSLIHYLGPIYSKSDMASVFSISDVFCIPGHIGLGLVEAFYWGVPVITCNVKHAPEIYYLKDGFNGYIVHSDAELSKKIIDLKSHSLLKTFSKNAFATYRESASPDKMLDAFIKVLT